MATTLLVGIGVPIAIITGVPLLFYWLATRALDRTAFRYDDPDDLGQQ